MADVVLNCKGMVCPLPVAQVQRKAREMNPGQTMEVEADCSSFPQDISEWSQKTGHPIISKVQNGSAVKVVIKF